MKRNTNKYSAYVGIDWADNKHDISLSVAGGKAVHLVIAHTPEDLREWLTKLRKQYPKGQIAICLEQSKGALIFHLLGYDFLTIFPVNPKSLARFREALTPSGAKSDFTDADYLREFVSTHRDRMRPWKPDNEHSRTIAFLAEGRRKAIDERTRLVNRLCSNLKMYFPQALELLGDKLYSKMALEFLGRWPSLADVKREGVETLEKFYTTHNCRSAQLIKQRLQVISSAISLTEDKAVITNCLITVKMLVGQIVQLNTSIEEYENELKKLYDTHPDRDIFDSFPGAGGVLGPRLLAAWGSDRDRHESANSMQKYSGIAPVTKASGRSMIVRRRLAFPTFLLQTFHEFANCSRRFSVWAQAYYEMLRDHGKNHHTAVRALAFKWIRIMYRCWKNRSRYSEIKYLQALKESNSPLRKYL